MATNQKNVVSIAGSTPIATGAYSQLVAATPIPFSKALIANGTDTMIKLAYGAAGSETDYAAVGPGQTELVDVGLNVMQVGTRLAVEAVGAASTTGTYSVSMIP